MDIMLNTKKDLFNSRGQVLLIVIITMIVALTVGLTLAARTITNLKISKQNEDSQRAFQAANAGIEKYLNQSSGGSNTLNNANVQTSITTVNGNQVALNNYETVDQDRGMDLWLSTYPTYTGSVFPAGGTLTFYWGGSEPTLSCSTGAGSKSAQALEVVILYGSVLSPSLQKSVFDPCSASRGNNFTTPSGSVGTLNNGSINGSTFPWHFSATVSVPANALIAKVIPLYNSTTVGIVSSAVLPSQGKVITSTGTSGDVSRKVVYYESYPQIPTEVFPYAMLSQ